MYSNKYTLYQLLELALRVPEIGAVNFNLLYYILKAIILEQGLGEIKPVFSLDVPLTAASNVLKKTVNGVTLRRSYSAESLESVQADKVLKRSASDESSEKPVSTSAVKAKDKWQKTILLKRVDGVEEEIAELHILISQLVDKISNFERVMGLQEAKFMKNIKELHDSLESKEDPDIAKKLEEMSSKIEMLIRIQEESEDETEVSTDWVPKDGTRLDATKPQEVKSDKSKQVIKELGNAKKKTPEVDEIELNEIKSDVPKLDDGKSDDILPQKDEFSENKLQEKESDEIKDEIKPGPTKGETGKSKKSRRRAKEQELTETIDGLVEEVNSIKEQINVKFSVQHTQEAAKKTVYDKKEIRDIVQGIIDEQESVSKADISKIDLELLNVSAEVHKAMEKYAVMGKTLSSDVNILKEKNLIMERTISKQDEDLEALKDNLDETVLNFESMKENIQCIEKEMTVLTAFSGIENRIEQLEEYVYSEHGEKDTRAYPKSSKTGDLHIAGIRRQASEEKDVVIFKPTEIEKATVPDIEEYSNKDDTGVETVPGKMFLAVSRDVVLVKDMEKKRIAPKLENKFTIRELDFDDDDVLPLEEPSHEIGEEPTAEKEEEVPLSIEVTKKHSEEKIKSSTFTSPDMLEEYSTQLRGQIVVFVRRRLNDFEIQLQHKDSMIATMRSQIDSLEKHSKELGEKLTFMDANFSQRAGDLAALKQMAENHQISIVNIVHHLDRKAESYAVNQKVSRKELTVIEDRVLKLCVTASSEITKLEEKIDSSLEKFNIELDKKLYVEEFEHRLKFVLHKLKLLENKMKDFPMELSVLDFEGIRPVEIKKYVASKDGTKIKQGRRKIETWSTSESIIPMLAAGEASPKTAMQIQRELEHASYRESKRYVEGAYTKIKVGRK